MHTSAWSIVHWWESRRVAYNAAVGAAGVATLTTMFVFAHLPPHPIPFMIPPVAVVAYGVLANICYSAGPVLDLLICRTWGDQYEAVGPALFRYGFVFSIGLTLLPIPLAVGSWIVRALFL
jgi:hypothetical protein